MNGGVNEFHKDIAEKATVDPIRSWRSDNIGQLKIERGAGQRAVDTEIRATADAIYLPPRGGARTKVKHLGVLQNMEAKRRRNKNKTR